MPANDQANLDSARFAGYAQALKDAGLTNHPIGVLDVDAVEDNVRDLQRRAAGTPIRVSSKSLRIRGLLDQVCARDGFSGVLSFTLAEALWLESTGYTDLLVAYPTADAAGLRQLSTDDSARAHITLMIDDTDQLDLIDAAAPSHPEIRVAVELDASYLLPGRFRFGAARSPLRSPADLEALAKAIVKRPDFRLVGMMAYEGQIAGQGNAGNGLGRVIRALQKASAEELRERRGEAVALLQRHSDLEFVNGGGTGSIESTASEDAVTEVAAGSGVLGPALFDHYEHFRPAPALYFGLPVVRRPARRTATLLGGGWIASGAPGSDRLPTVAWPKGLRYRLIEGAGEVQTPLTGGAAKHLHIGETVWLRHAKAGEVCEHLNEVVAVRRKATNGDFEVIGELPTYRGEGKAFL